MSWVGVLKFGREGSKKTFDNFDKARRIAHSWSFAVPHVIREKDGKFTVMMKKDTSTAYKYGPVIWLQEARR